MIYNTLVPLIKQEAKIQREWKWRVKVEAKGRVEVEERRGTGGDDFEGLDGSGPGSCDGEEGANVLSLPGGVDSEPRGRRAEKSPGDDAAVAVRQQHRRRAVLLDGPLDQRLQRHEQLRQLVFMIYTMHR